MVKNLPFAPFAIDDTYTGPSDIVMFAPSSKQSNSPKRSNVAQFESERGRGRSYNLVSIFPILREDAPLLESDNSRVETVDNNNGMWSHRWFPGPMEDDDETTRPHVLEQQPRRHHGKIHHLSHRSIRRRIFLLLTEPTTSYASAIFFVILIIAISASNVIMIMQTMDAFQFTPDDCETCGGKYYYVFDDDAVAIQPGVPCVCPPAPFTATVKAIDYTIYFFTVEWSLRVLCFEPPPAERSHSFGAFLCQWWNFLTETTTVMDALAIFPYYMEIFEKTSGLMSLRLLRLFRVFQLVRLGQYNSNFSSLTNVLHKSTLYLKLLMVVLLFAAAFFGSIIYWLEKGDWKYYQVTQSYAFLRPSLDGISQEPSPFTSIPIACWWFLVTATTVGYGDMYPTTVGGRFVAAMAMLTGVLVIAFPVGVFSDLWSQELKKRGVHHLVDSDDDDDDDGDNQAWMESPADNKLGDDQAHGQTELMPSERSGMTLSDRNGTTVSQRSGMTLSDRNKRMTLSRTVPEHENQVMLAAKDVATLTKHMRIMEKSQERIRGILAKYDIET